MSWGLPSAIVVQQVLRCKIQPDPNSERHCNNPAGDHTVLDQPLCDDCWERIRA